MKLRYYLRGIGLGVIVAAAICICASMNNKKTMSDAEIKERAKQLGMVEETTLLANAAEEKLTEEEAETLVEESTVPVETVEATEPETEEEIPTPTPEVTPEPTPEATPEPTPEPTPEQSNTEEYVLFEVKSGSGSDTVARNLESAGLVKNAGEFDKYLCANGYDRRIRAGSHEIPKNASEEEIAKIISSK